MIYTVTLNPAIDYHIVKTEDETIKESYMTPGGKGINVSQMLSNLGVFSVATGFLGGIAGQMIEASIAQNKYIKQAFIQIEEPTRINVKIHEPFELAYNHQGPQVSFDEFNQLITYLHSLSSDDLVVFSGRGIVGIDNLYEKLVFVCKEKNIPFILDLHGKEFVKLIKYQPLLIKPNINELKDAFHEAIKSKDEVIHYGKKLIELGAKHVMISLGKDGALFITKEEIYEAKPLQIDVVSTVGAGDAMVAGFIDAYAKKQPIKTCFKQAVACATATVSSKEMASLKDVQEIFDHVLIKEISRENI